MQNRHQALKSGQTGGLGGSNFNGPRCIWNESPSLVYVATKTFLLSTSIVIDINLGFAVLVISNLPSLAEEFIFTSRPYAA